MNCWYFYCSAEKGRNDRAIFRVSIVVLSFLSNRKSVASRACPIVLYFHQGDGLLFGDVITSRWSLILDTDKRK